MIIDTFTNRLNKAMAIRNIRQVDLVRKTKFVMQKIIKDYDGDGIDKSLLNKYIKGVADAKQDNLYILAKALDVSEGWLMGFDVSMEREWIPDDIKIDNGEVVNITNQTIRIPLYGLIKAGIPMEAQEDIIDYIEIPKEWVKGGKSFYGLKISGNSMFPKYAENDIVIFENVNCYQEGNNKDCAVMVNATECTFKKVFINDNGITLQPYNTDEFQPNMYSREQAEHLPIRIVGIAVRRITDIE